MARRQTERGLPTQYDVRNLFIMDTTDHLNVSDLAKAPPRRNRLRCRRVGMNSYPSADSQVPKHSAKAYSYGAALHYAIELRFS